MGAGTLAQAHLATTRRCATRNRNTDPTAPTTRPQHYRYNQSNRQRHTPSERLQYDQTDLDVRYYHANGFTFAFLLSKRLRHQKEI